MSRGALADDHTASGFQQRKLVLAVWRLEVRIEACVAGQRPPAPLSAPWGLLLPPSLCLHVPACVSHGPVTGSGPGHPGRPQPEVTEYPCQGPFSQESQRFHFPGGQGLLGDAVQPTAATWHFMLDPVLLVSLNPCPPVLLASPVQGDIFFVYRHLSCRGRRGVTGLGRGECAGRIPASHGTGVPEQSWALGQHGAGAGTPTPMLLVCKACLLQLLH